MTRKEIAIKNALQNWVDGQSEFSDGRGFDQIVDKFGFLNVINFARGIYRGFPQLICNNLRNSKILQVRPNKIERIGFYYENLRNGGIQRVLSNLLPLIKNKGFEVFLITLEDSSPDDYFLDDSIMRISLKQYEKAFFRKRPSRSEVFKDVVKRYDLDLFVHNSIYTSDLAFDIMTLQETDVPVIVHTHNIFSLFLKHGRIPFFVAQSSALRLANGIVCLSDTDLEWYKLIGCSNVVQIDNPINLDDHLNATDPVERDNNLLLWVGRLVPQKRPLDIIHVFSQVHNSNPKARLMILGDCSDSDIYLEMLDLIENLNLSDFVEFVGYHPNTQVFYSSARLMISTSEVEGFPMTFYESMRDGLPIVAYDLPYLRMVKDVPQSQSGIVTIPQPHRVHPWPSRRIMAESIVIIMKNDELWDHLSQNQTKNYKLFSSVDIAKEWMTLMQNLFDSDAKASEARDSIMIDTFFSDLIIGIDRYKNLELDKQSTDYDLGFLKTIDWQRTQSQNDLFNSKKAQGNLRTEFDLVQSKSWETKIRSSVFFKFVRNFLLLFRRKDH